MSLTKQHIKILEINAETLIAPPPFSHYYRIFVNFTSDIPQVDFNIAYSGREQLGEEEILEEGFTLADDFSWQGELPKNWKFAIFEQLRKTKSLFEEAKPHAQQLLELSITYENGEQTSGVPSNSESWEYFSQELIQAIYELGQKELPLEIIYLENSGKSDSLRIRLQPSFSFRKVRAEKEENGKKDKKEHEWEQLKPLLEAIYRPDYDAEKASDQPPKKPGKYLMPG
ncbi:MAG: hypothetical protein ACLFT3_13020, partial [Cyclobacteriaceae bacterium]